jgi:hypothetical protein
MWGVFARKGYNDVVYYIRTNDNNQYASYISNYPYDEKFHFITAVWYGGRMSIYLDGIKKHDISIPLGLSLPGSNCMVVVGAYQPCGAGYITSFFNGIIDELRVYNRALSDSEIKALYEATK